MAEDRTIDDNAKTEADSGPVAQPNFTMPLGDPIGEETMPRPGGALLVTRRTVGRFRIDAQLGSGGMADVFRAYDPVLDREVALKVLHSKLSSPDDARGIERVLREARAAAALTHPNTVTIYEVGEADGEVFIAMELLHGRVLREVVAEGGTTLEQKVRWLLQAARALAAAHARGLVHRDVKPENMFVCSDGTLKLLDFGIAKRETDTTESGSDAYPTGPSSLRTQAGRRFGTPRYMAPEQHAGRPTDARTDEYAWGLVAFELLCGSLVTAEHPTATADGEVEPAGAAASMRSAELRIKVPGLAEEVIAIIARATDPKQSARFPSMTPIVEALERHTMQSVPVAVSAPLATSSPKHAKWLVAASIVVGAIAVLLGIAIKMELPTSRASAKLASAAPPLCKVTRTRTASRAPTDIVIPRTDGALVTLHNPPMSVSVDVELPGGGAPRPLLPFTIGGADSKEQVQFAVAQAVSVQGDPDVFVGLAMMSAPSITADGSSMVLLGSVAPRGSRHLRNAPSGFAVIPVGSAVAGVMTTRSIGPEFPGVKLFVLGAASDPVLVDNSPSLFPTMASISKSRFAIAYQAEDQIRFAIFDNSFQRLGDILPVTHTKAGPALAIADGGKTAAVFFSESSNGKMRLMVSTLTIGETAFHPPVTVIDEPLLDSPPQTMPLGGGNGSAVLWLMTSGAGLTIRISPIGPNGTLSGPSTVATASAIYQLHATTTASGLALAWNDGTGTTTIADVECQMPVVSTPAR